MSDNTEIAKALAALKANPPSPDSPLPWRIDEDDDELLRSSDPDALRVADVLRPLDARCIAARVTYAPILAAEVERLQGLVATGDRLRAEDAMDTLKAQARVAELEARLAAARVAVGMVYAPARGPGTIAYDRWLEARRAVGLEG